MAKQSEKIAVEEDLLDIISNLPINVITHILDFLHTKDAARMSVLSRKWRYFWASHPNFYIRYSSSVSDRQRTKTLNEMTNTINKILFQHIGPIQKFSFRIPWFDSTNEFDLSLVNHWLMYLSRNGIRELALNCEDEKASYILPFHIFSAPELVTLKLRKCVFNSPNADGAFRKLNTLSFCNINFRSGKITSALNTPQLSNLRFESCSKVCHLKICAPKLKTLIVLETKDVKLIDFQMYEITTIAIMGPCCTLKKTGLAELVHRWCRVSSLYLDGRCFKFLTPDTPFEMLPTRTRCLKHIVLKDIDCGDLHQISCILYLLRCSTSLSRLEISFLYNLPAPTIEAANYLDAGHNMNWTIDCLEIVVIHNPCRYKEEMRFIKSLLSCSPKLKRLFVEEKVSMTDPSSNYNLLKELVRFPRASKEAEIIFEQNVKVAKIPDVGSFVWW